MSIQNYDKAYASPLRNNYKKLAAAIIYKNLNDEEFWWNTKDCKAWRSMLFVLAEADEGKARKKFEENNSAFDTEDGFISLRQLGIIKGINYGTLTYWLHELSLPYEIKLQRKQNVIYLPFQTARVILDHIHNSKEI